MAFSEFDLDTALSRFGLRQEPAVLFPNAPAVEPGQALLAALDENEPLALTINSEFARNIYLIAPVLMEAKRLGGVPFQVLPGVTLDVDRPSGLNGFCDYLISRSDSVFTFRGPVMAVLEAKREDINAGLGQCVASMEAIRLFNERAGTTVPSVYGCVTSGTNWRFLKLQDGVVAINRREHPLSELGVILGILIHIVREG